jgi:GNAT superfamily N-acetyltransferase
MIELRLAERSELDWVNQCYDEVGFVHSHFDNEIIAIAEVAGEKAGLGRLVAIDANHLELGGMYVFEAFRGQGVAKKIVEFLLKYAKPHQTIYCIPFEHLHHFYKRFGFAPCQLLEKVPTAVLEKYRWCQQTYETPTLLLAVNEV